MTYDREQVGKALLKYRRRLGMTQEQAAEKMGVSQNFYARIEVGTSGMSMETLCDLCDAFHITPNDILMPRAEEPEGAEAQQAWLMELLKNCTDKQRAAAIDILKAYLRAI